MSLLAIRGSLAGKRRGAPKLNTPPPQSNKVGDVVSLEIHNEGGAPTEIEYLGTPTIVPGTALTGFSPMRITGTLTTPTGEFSVSVFARNSAGSSETAKFTWKVA